MNARHAALSDRGRVRQANEDRWFADDALQLYLVADGMGGHLAGELAARIVAERLPAKLRSLLDQAATIPDEEAAQQVRQAVARLSRQIRTESQNQPGLDGMGSTLVLAWIRGSQALITHLGDSSAFLLRGGRLKRLTKDHTLVQLLVAEGRLDAKETADHPAASQLTRYVGMQGDALPDSRWLELQAGDRLLLCSDGLTGMLPNQQIAVLLSHADLSLACQYLLAAAIAAGGRDNVTAVVIELMS
jgi:protein phosphatase